MVPSLSSKLGIKRGTKESFSDQNWMILLGAGQELGFSLFEFSIFMIGILVFFLNYQYTDGFLMSKFIKSYVLGSPEDHR